MTPSSCLPPLIHLANSPCESARGPRGPSAGSIRTGARRAAATRPGTCRRRSVQTGRRRPSRRAPWPARRGAGPAAGRPRAIRSAAKDARARAPGRHERAHRNVATHPTAAALFDPVRIGAWDYPHRVLMAPLTRCRATPETLAAGAGRGGRGDRGPGPRPGGRGVSPVTTGRARPATPTTRSSPPERGCSGARRRSPIAHISDQ
jgi:hypothetical protein